MAVLRQEPVLCSVMLCIVLCADLHAHQLTGTNGGAPSLASTISFQDVPDVPPQCTVTKAAGRLTLDCEGAQFSQIIQTLRELGNELHITRVHSCTPRQPVSLNASCFANNTNLTQLILVKCGVVDIAAGTFAGLRHLDTLKLTSNLISSVTTDTLSGLGNLKTLAIADNHILALTSMLFANMSSLTELDVTRNKIGQIENDTFHGLAKLKKLSLNFNFIQDIDEDTFRGLHGLDELDLSNNQLQLLETGVFKPFKNLTSLTLNSNPVLRLDDHAFRDLKKLESLYLRNIPSALAWYKNPQPRLFAGLLKLKALELEGMSLSALDNSDLSFVFTDQRETLQHLDLRDTQLTNSLLAMTNGLKQVQTLWLEDNQITFIEQFSLPQIAGNYGVLLIDNNKIAYIDERAFEGRYSMISMDRNPLDCSCTHAAFSRWLRSPRAFMVFYREDVTCRSPISLYGTRVMDYDPVWWQCSEYIPLIALISTAGFLLIVSLIILIVYCNRINLKHWILERRVASMPTDEEEDTERQAENAPLLNPALCRNALRQGKTGAYIIHDIYERSMLDWVNKYLEDQLHNHPMKITLQFPAGPEVIPLWKQVKDFSFQVHAFLVLVTDQFLVNHWPEIAEKSGVDNIMKCVFVLHGMKTSELPKEMKQLQCPCFQWPETGGRFTTLERERDQFWKQVRLAVKETKK